MSSKELGLENGAKCGEADFEVLNLEDWEMAVPRTKGNAGRKWVGLA